MANAASMREEAENIAVKALGFIAADPELLPRFLAITGIDVQSIRKAAAEPGFLAGVLQFILAHEPTLLRFAEETGFGEIRMDYRAEIKQEPHFATSFEMLMRFSGNPLDPTLGEELRAALDDDERAEFEAHLRQEIERRPLVPMRMASVYLRAVKPDA